MAEATVSLTLARIKDPLIQQASFLLGVGSELQHLRTELMQLKWFLNDADHKLEQDKRVRNWVTEIRNAAYDAEDVIDTFITKVASREDHHFFDKLLVPIFTDSLYAYRIRKQIKSIRNRVLHISTEMEKYGVCYNNEEEESSALIYTHKREMEENIISREDCVRDVIKQLMIDDERLRIVSIVGTGGLGKTALAKTIYHHYHLEHRFDCKAWVFISQQCTTKDVLQATLAQVVKGRNSSYRRMKEEDLVENLYQILAKNRYLVILDNIGRKEAWDGLKYAFPNGKIGSKVLFTTRKREVTMYADHCTSDPFQLPSLTHEESWKLFCEKLKSFPTHVFASSSCPTEFEKIGREMVRKCDGLPLPILVLAGMLATKRSLKEWKLVQRDMNAYLKKYRQGQGGFHGILCFSYQELPFYLKPCFLYFGLFPEGQEIRKKALIRLWIAEGFVTHQGEGKVTMEDVAENYLQDLINRSMVETSEPDFSSAGGVVKTCHINHLLRDLCLSKAKEEDFLDSKSRRIAIHSKIPPENIVQKHPHLRSLLCFGERHSQDLMEVRCGISDIKQLKLLRVLHLQDMHLHSWKPIGSLFNLRYLVLTSMNPSRSIDMPPDSIAPLKSLQTLDIRGYSSVRLPLELSNLVNLRHLLLPLDENQGNFQLISLQNLETLKYVKVKNLMRGNAMEKLTNLRSLGVMFRSSEEAEVVLKSPMVMSGSIQSFQMYGEYFTNLEPLSCCHYLKKLKIHGGIADGNLGFLPVKLSKLTLVGSKLVQDPMAVLGKLPGLKVLSLGKDSYNGCKMINCENGFPLLEVLMLSGLDIEEWKVEKGAMPSLKRLYMRDLPKLKMIPQGLNTISTLQFIHK